MEGDLDGSPKALAANSGKAFLGSVIFGMGFTFDDKAFVKGESESIAKMRRLIETDRRNADCIFPYIGGEELNTEPRHAYQRYVINFFDFPLSRDLGQGSWSEMDNSERATCRVTGIVPGDYPSEVAEDWPDLLEIVRLRVKPERDVQKRDALRERWWQYAEKRPGLYTTIAPLQRVLAINCGACPHMAFAFLPANMVYANTLDVVAFSTFPPFAVLQSRVHELWARFFSLSMKDDLRYAPSDCFRTFPFPENFETHSALEVIGETYYTFRSQLMIGRNEGLTKTYNRFHARGENELKIARLRALHLELDTTVLRAYGWEDLADRAAPEFIEQDVDEVKAPKTRLDWSLVFKDEVLARLLALNSERAAAEGAAGLTVPLSDEELERE